MKRRSESSCPICYSLDVFGDKWTLLILRDMLVGGKRYYREFLNAGEGIATNVLADRLKSMLESGLITKAGDPENGAQAIYSPTTKARALTPVLEAMGAWALEYGPSRLVSPAPSRKVA